MNALVERMVTEAERTGFAGNDLISLFMAATDPESGERMSRTQLRDEVLTFLAAGHETTANGLAFTLDLLARNPEWQERAVAEIREVVGAAPLTFEQLPRLDLLRRIIDESMRLFPPAWSVERTALEEDHFDGHRVAPGDMVMLSIWATHRNEEHWPDPDRFDPDRFLPANSAGRHRMAFLPFGLGPRMCIGKHFAIFELQAMLATLLPRLHFAPVSDAPLHLDPLVTLRPTNGVPLRISPRTPLQAEP
jgi:cytochrome P450